MAVLRNLVIVRRFCLDSRELYRGSAVELAFNRYGDSNEGQRSTPLVICHGLFGSKQNWHTIAKKLHQRLLCTIYTLDLRNHGDSPWNSAMTYEDMSIDVVRFLETVSEQFGDTQFNLLGHSMGGRVAMRVAIEPSWQHLINRLIIEDVSPKSFGSHSSVNFRKYIKGMLAMDLNKSRRELLKDFEIIVNDSTVRQFLLLNVVSNEVAGQSRWRCNLEAIDRNLEHILQFTIPSGSFSGPTLFCYGQRSDYVNIADKDYIQSIFPNVAFKSIANAGHWVHAEQPIAFIDAICRFLQQ